MMISLAAQELDRRISDAISVVTFEGEEENVPGQLFLLEAAFLFLMG